jgi:hypothetical protein
MSKSWFNIWNYLPDFFGPREEEKTIKNETAPEIVENSQISDSSCQFNQEPSANETENKEYIQNFEPLVKKQTNFQNNSPVDSKETEKEFLGDISPIKDTSLDTSLLSEPDLSPEITKTSTVETKKRKNELSEEPNKKMKLTPKIMFTGITNETKLKKYQNMVTKLNGINSDDINEITHLITDKVHRTKKFLCALNQSHIVSLQWVLYFYLIPS